MAERAQYDCLLAETFHKTDVMVGESTEFFYHVFLRVRVFVCTDMYTLAYEYRIVALQIFFEQSIYEFVSFRLEQVEMIHAVLLASDFRFVMGESQ